MLNILVIKANVIGEEIPVMMDLQTDLLVISAAEKSEWKIMSVNVILKII